MFKFVALLTFLSAANGAPGYQHGGVIHAGIAIPFVTGQASGKDATSDISDKTLTYQGGGNRKKIVPSINTGHATSYSNRVDATGKRINNNNNNNNVNVLNEEFSIPISTGVSSYSSREDGSSKSGNCLSAVPNTAKSLVNSEGTKAIVTPILTKTVLIAHAIPVLSSYGLKLAYEAGLGYGHGYGYGSGYGYLHGHPYVHGHPYIYGR